ncbi:transposase [Pirellulaceae bacterium SH501]
MPSTPRCEQFVPDEICLVHCTHRCVRRAWLTGIDELTGKDYTHRREWIRQRLESLASVFGIDVLEYAVLSNHLHVILRNRPDVVATWSDEEVASRWLRLFPGFRLLDVLAEANEEDVKAALANPEEIALHRTRLSDISWFMGCLAEVIARRANAEDKCTGCFWEGRFKSKRLLDEESLLACAMYIDLNVLRAGLAETIELSMHTSVYDRIEAAKGAVIESEALNRVPLSKEESIKRRTKKTIEEQRKALKSKGPRPLVPRDAWLAPLTLDPNANSLDPQACTNGLRASNKGFLRLNLDEYLQLLRWTAKNKKPVPGSQYPIPEELKPLFAGLGVDPSMWCDLVWNYKKYFGTSRCSGRPEAMMADAKRTNKAWSRGQRQAAACFA